jgi:hypothetical protein
MGTFTFNTPDGKPFEIKGPDGLTLEQAKAIFDKQVSTGSLVGFKPGDVLSATTQAAKGLASAQAQVNQALSGITGALGAGIPGAAGAIGAATKALGQAGGALSGSLSGTAAGLTGAIGPAVSNVIGTISSTATQAISTINKTISTVAVTNPINTANFAKEVPALAKIGSMAESTVTGVMAQVKNLVGQAPTAISNGKGVGSYGLDVRQLETAGIVKPGTSALVTAGASTLSSVLKSPSVFTGKDGITNISGLLSNPQAQSTIQQGLMATGIAGLATQGIPVGVLSPAGIAGMAVNASKSLTDATAFVKGLPIPGDATGAIKAAFTTNVRDGAFAAILTETKIAPPFKAIVTPVPSSDTANRETLNAASTRVVGNPKVPEPNYGAPAAASTDDITALLEKFLTENNKYLGAITALGNKVSVLENQQSITQQDWDTVRQEFKSAGQAANAIITPLREDVTEKINQLSGADKKEFVGAYKSIEGGPFKDTVKASSDLLDRINLLKSKIDSAQGTTTA